MNRALQFSRLPSSGVLRRGMATEKQLRVRINGTKNIAKITKSMKMVSAAKLRGDQQRLQSANPFSAWAAKITGAEVPMEGMQTSHFPARNLVVTVTTDKGLCGGINTILARVTRQMLASIEAEGKSYQLLVLGEKGRASFRRAYADKIVASLTERTAPNTFETAVAIAQEVISHEFDAVHLCYNEFVSAIVYTASVKTITPLLNQNDPFLHTIEVEPEKDNETLQNFFEYTLATQIYHSLMENATAEQSSRMNAMENASKNASEMITKLTLQYNRARQARITTELIEIISGAAALKG